MNQDRKHGAALRRLMSVAFSALALSGCASPEISKPHAEYGKTTAPQAIEANAEADAAIRQYRAKFGPSREHELVVERDVDIPMRDGTVLKADIFRPKLAGRYPVIMSMTAYMKDRPWPVPSDHEGGPGRYQSWELPDPQAWIPWGYALVRVDTRGFGRSMAARAEPLNGQEANDYSDAIEWAARRPWSSGKVGLSGVSYMAMNQWLAAAKQPPSLAAIIPWEGGADQYRDTFFRGGIWTHAFATQYISEFYRDYTVRGWAGAQSADAIAQVNIGDFMRHRLDDGFWTDRRPDWSKVTVPLLSAGNWNGWIAAGHLRGNTEGFKRASSPSKKLRMHTGAHQDAYYSKEGFLEQLRFYDCWLKGLDNGVKEEPPVKLAIRYGTDRFEFGWRYESEWPIARTEYRKMYLRAAAGGGSGGFQAEVPAQEASATYEAPGGYSDGDNRVMFVSEPFDRDTEITGEIKLNVWVSSTIDDVNLHAALLVVQPTLHPLLHKWYGKREIVSVGWLSAQQREVDPTLATDSRPHHRHARLLPTKPGEPVELQVEIWPTSMVYRKGSRLALVLSSDSPMTVQRSPVGAYRARHAQDTIHTGGRFASYLQVPVVPALQARP